MRCLGHRYGGKLTKPGPDSRAARLGPSCSDHSSRSLGAIEMASVEIHQGQRGAWPADGQLGCRAASVGRIREVAAVERGSSMKSIPGGTILGAEATAGVREDCQRTVSA